MKRKRGLKKAKKFDDPDIQRLGTSFADLPSSVTVDILLRLPIKSVLICRRVCKSWRNIISDPVFAKLHFERAHVDIMIRTNDPKCVSRTLHLLEFEPEKLVESEKFCSCVGFPKPRCKLHVKLEAKFKLPLRDAKLALDKMLEAKDGGSGTKRSYIWPKPGDDKFDVVNSCNGLLCLCDPKVRNPLVVCNPVTGEFIRLPEGNKVGEFKQANFNCGFGFHERTNEYKVIRFYDRYVQDPTNAQAWSYKDRVVEMHTLGTGTWKYVGVFGDNADGLRFPTSLHGALHWLRLPSYSRGLSIIAFDFECERFHLLPSPSNGFGKKGITSTDNICMGELNGCLYICCSSISCPIILWVMKKYSVEESWTKVFSIHRYFAGASWPFDSYHPIKLFNKGTGILFYQSSNWLIYYDLKKNESTTFMVRGTRSKFEAMAYTPSLISLKNALKGDHFEVLNVRSRCALFQLWEEKEVLFLA